MNVMRGTNITANAVGYENLTDCILFVKVLTSIL